MDGVLSPLSIIERETDKLFWAAVRLQHHTNNLGLSQATDDLASIIAWAAAWQEKLSCRRTSQMVLEPLPLAQHALPF